LAAPLLGIGVAVSGALYFADRRMKSADNHFRGFPGLWNVAAFYLFLLHPAPALSSLAVIVLIVATFAPFHVVHPVRVVRLRWLTLSLIAIWGVLSAVALANDFDVGAAVKIALCAIAAYVVASDAAIRLVRSFKA
jgi:phosphatidylcholine synthase